MDLSEKESLLRSISVAFPPDESGDIANRIAAALIAVRNATIERCLAVCNEMAADAQEAHDELQCNPYRAETVDRAALHEHSTNVARAIAARIRGIRWGA